MIVRILSLLLVLSPLASADEVSWKPLRSPSAQATSYLQTNWNRFTENYHPTYVLDDNPRTAWVEGQEGNGEGSVLTLPLSAVPTARAVRLRIRNGYQKSRGLLTANAAPERVRVRVRDSHGDVTGEMEATLRREMGWQEVVIALNGGGVSEVDLEVLSVHEGSRYRDTCISDVLVDIDSDETYSAAAEAGRLHRASTWMAERAAAAEYFASQPAEYPFHLSQYTREEVAVEDAVAEQLISAERAHMEALRDSPVKYNVDHTRRIEHSGDIWEFSGVLQHFVPSNLAWFETDRDYIVDEKDEIEMDGGGSIPVGEMRRSSERVEWADDTNTTPRRVYLNVRSVSYGRGTYTSNTDYLLTYNAAGRLGTVYAHRVGHNDIDGASTTESVYRLTYDGDGKVTAWTVTERIDGLDEEAMRSAGDWTTPIHGVSYSRATARAQQ